jgi:uncharacterized protein YoxC
VHLAGGAWALLQAPALHDTVVVLKQIAAERSWFDTVSGIASIVISLALLALAIGLLPAAWNFRKSYKKLNDMLDKVYGDVNPIMRHASTIADNVNYVTTAVRVDVQQVSRTVATANERLQEAVRLTERRLNEFNALMNVVQGEAEGAFVTAASTLRGMREGANTFRDAALGDAAMAAEARDVAEDAYDDAYTFDFGDLSDGTNVGREGGRAEVGGERPRIRPRPGTGSGA